MSHVRNILFFETNQNSIIAVSCGKTLSQDDIKALEWLFSDARSLDADRVEGLFIGPRREMITPWSTTAVEITQNMNIEAIGRIEEFFRAESESSSYDKMLQRMYKGLDQDVFTVNRKPEDIVYITDFEKYNVQEGLALSADEIAYLQNLSAKLGRPLTDSEVFGFSQVNSEHCRHKIFNGTFIIDGQAKELSLFKLIKKTTQEHPGIVVSAYKDNCAFVEGPTLDLFHPQSGSKPSFFERDRAQTVISLKAETHNFPTTVEPFNGAATGTGGEIRDRMAGGKGSFPIAGTAVYMTPYPRFEENPRPWEKAPRSWLYQTPQQILIKASNGASDFGNKFGQPIICGSLSTFEYSDEKGTYGYDKVIMQAGGVGYAKKRDCLKEEPKAGDAVLLMGGDNYRIGMGGGAVSSVATGEYADAIELNAVQRSNPEMQKRVYNAIRAVAESGRNSIISVHDHGAGGHLNCLSELVESTGGTMDIAKLPIGDKTLSYKEIIGNESQERMGMVVDKADVAEIRAIAERERAPFYEIGETTGRHNFTLMDSKTGAVPMNLAVSDMLGSTPKTVMEDVTIKRKFAEVPDVKLLTKEDIYLRIKQLLSLEQVACKDWLTNKVDRCVTGLIACQQTCGEIQLPLNDVAVTAIGYDSNEGIATSIGHACIAALIDPAAGERLTIAEALTNLVWADIEGGLDAVSLSANWMWPTRNPGEDSRLYSAVQGASDFACALGVNIPTGKDSMSMTQKYKDGTKVLAPGSMIISTVARVKDISKTVHANFAAGRSELLYVPFVKDARYPLGGSAFSQIFSAVGSECPDVEASYFKKCFNAVQELVDAELLLAGHDVSAGGLLTALLESCFPNVEGGVDVDLSGFDANVLFAETPAVVLQVADGAAVKAVLDKAGVAWFCVGTTCAGRSATVKYACDTLVLDIDKMSEEWFRTSYLFDKRQTSGGMADERFKNYCSQPLRFRFPEKELWKEGLFAGKEEDKPVAAIIREKGSNSDREMAWALYMAGFKVKDVHTTDLTTGRETLEDVRMIVFVGGFSNADVLGSAKGWAGALHYNEKARKTLENFYSRKDTMSLGVCNGCQLMAELDLVTPGHIGASPKMKHNVSHKHECAFVGVEVPASPSIMLSSLQGASLGIWVSHGEGRFGLPAGRKLADQEFSVALRYSYDEYPANPNGSEYAIAGVCSKDGRHLAVMPHPERGLRPYNWAWYPEERRHDEATPWVDMFINARKWLLENKG